jgi:hypothetical protein
MAVSALAGVIFCRRGLKLGHTFLNQNVVVIDKIMYHTSSSNEEISVQSSKIYLTESKFKCKYLLFNYNVSGSSNLPE